MNVLNTELESLTDLWPARWTHVTHTSHTHTDPHSHTQSHMYIGDDKTPERSLCTAN